MSKVLIIAEIGINHNGELSIAKELIDVAKEAGCDAVKFQTRNINVVYSDDELNAPRETPYGTTNRDLKEQLELDLEDYIEIDRYCKKVGMPWFSSPWNMDSVKFLKRFDMPFFKVASAMIAHSRLLELIAKEKKFTFISTGAATLHEIDHAVGIFKMYDCPFTLMHCNATYPMKPEDANLLYMDTLRNRYKVPVGYSGHESGLIVSCAAVALGAKYIERHITLDRSMFGSDQAASLEPHGLKKLVEYIRTIERSFGDGQATITEDEMKVRNKLRYYEKEFYKINS